MIPAVIEQSPALHDPSGTGESFQCISGIVVAMCGVLDLCGLRNCWCCRSAPNCSVTLSILKICGTFILPGRGEPPAGTAERWSQLTHTYQCYEENSADPPVSDAWRDTHQICCLLTVIIRVPRNPTWMTRLPNFLSAFVVHEPSW